MPPHPLTANQARHVRVLREAAEKILADNAILEVRVIAARRDKLSWKLIGQAVGITRQSATVRFCRLPEISEMEYKKEVANGVHG